MLSCLRAYEVGFNTNENEENYICGFDDGGLGGVYSPWPPLRGGRDSPARWALSFPDLG